MNTVVALVLLQLNRQGGNVGGGSVVINKTILNEVGEHKRNIFTMWFDYKKAFDLIPHQWLLEALKLAKLPADLIKCIETLAKKLVTNITLQTEKERSVSSLIRYLTGILQGDSMSLILFVLCVNPLSQ